MSARPEGSPEPLSEGTRQGFVIEGPVVSAQRAWRLIGDTDWMNRAGGNGAVVRMQLESQRDGFPLVVGELEGPLGMRLPFAEVWSSWVAGRFFRQVRDITSLIAARSDYRAELVSVAGGVRPRIEMSVEGPGWAGPLRRGLSLAAMERRWRDALATLEGPEEAEVGERALSAEANAALARWAEAAPAEIVARFATLYRTGRPADLARMRAFVLADRWELPRTAVLAALLDGIGAGAVELFWSVRCVRCYGQVGGGRLLSDIADHADCPACGVRSQTDLGGNVEVLFAPHPSVISALDVNFCTVFPAMAPSQAAVFTLAPGQRVDTSLHLPPGRWRIGPGQGVPDVNVVSGDDGAAELSWRTGQPTEGEPLRLRTGEVRLAVENASAARTRVYLTQEGGALPVVVASELTLNDRFRRQLGHQVLANNLRVGVRTISLVFTDLSGSTAMYEEIGDARAFAVVRDHFDILRKAAADEGGTVVKTIGDAVMAAFFDAPAAMRAALRMQRDFRAWVPSLGLQHPPSLKVGLHVGPALAVHTDQAGLDYFGGTVNLAARAQGAADAGDVVWTQAVHDQPAVQAVLAAAGHGSETMARQLKGLGEVRLYRSTGPAGAP